jgi:IS1 family transposase
MRKVCRERSCPHPGCNLYGKTGAVNITRHGFMKTKYGRRRRFYCLTCGKTFSYGCVYGVVMKTGRKDRVTKVDRYRVIGSRWQLEEALLRSEDSSKLNTSFIERLNLTIRQGSAYLYRKSACHARVAENLEQHLHLLQCYYNFIRPHRALRFGRELRTPAMQAGLASRRLSFREIFTAVEVVRFFVVVGTVVVFDRGRVGERLRLAA